MQNLDGETSEKIATWKTEQDKRILTWSMEVIELAQNHVQWGLLY